MLWCYALLNRITLQCYSKICCSVLVKVKYCLLMLECTDMSFSNVVLALSFTFVCCCSFALLYDIFSVVNKLYSSCLWRKLEYLLLGKWSTLLIKYTLGLPPNWGLSAGVLVLLCTHPEGKVRTVWDHAYLFKGCSINKLQNGVILLNFIWKIPDIHFVMNWI